jgi:hypothetical protein
MRFFLLAMGFGLWGMDSRGQTNMSHQLSADLTAGIALIHFTEDPMVPPRRRDKRSVGDEININLHYAFPLKNKQFQFNAGVGYVERNIYIRKYNFEDFLLAILVFSNPSRDSFKIQSLRLNSKYINIPAGILYSLTKNPKQRVQFIGKLQLNTAFLAGKKAHIQFDEAYLNPTPAERTQYEQQYEETARGVTFSIEPKIDILVRIFKSGGIKLGYLPFTFYLNSWNKKISRNTISITSSIGIFYKW